MRKVKGRTLCEIQTKSSTSNEIGESLNTWTDTISVHGVLGLQSGDSNRTTYDAKIAEATHVFICDYRADIYALADSDVRCIINGKMYDIKYIDNPDELDIHLEIYLKYVGGQSSD